MTVEGLTSRLQALEANLWLQASLVTSCVYVVVQPSVPERYLVCALHA